MTRGHCQTHFVHRQHAFPHTAVLQDLSGSGIVSTPYVCLLGLLTACWSLIGYDAAAHLTEETKSADQTAGWPMIYAIGASFLTGLIYLVVLTVCLQVSTQPHRHSVCRLNLKRIKLWLQSAPITCMRVGIKQRLQSACWSPPSLQGHM